MPEEMVVHHVTRRGDTRAHTPSVNCSCAPPCSNPAFASWPSLFVQQLRNADGGELFGVVRHWATEDDGSNTLVLIEG